MKKPTLQEKLEFILLTYSLLGDSIHIGFSNEDDDPKYFCYAGQRSYTDVSLDSLIDRVYCIAKMDLEQQEKERVEGIVYAKTKG